MAAKQEMGTIKFLLRCECVKSNHVTAKVDWTLLDRCQEMYIPFESHFFLFPVSSRTEHTRWIQLRTCSRTLRLRMVSFDFISVTAIN